ncbi:MAG: RING finger domain-containing protein [Candidatus Heimdallarchaeota archaeon]
MMNFCPYCGSQLNKERKGKLNFCPYCGEQLTPHLKEFKCTICHQKIKHNQTSINCAYCESPYHYNCVVNWLSTYNSCPTCQNTFLNPYLKIHKN